LISVKNKNTFDFSFLINVECVCHGCSGVQAEEDRRGKCSNSIPLLKLKTGTGKQAAHQN